jgi:hypothetical protein
MQSNQFPQQNYFKPTRQPQFQKPQYNTNHKQNQYPSDNSNYYNRSNNQYNQFPKEPFQPQPVVDELSIIQSLKYVSEKYPQLIKLNQQSSGLLNQARAQASPRFFVIKSFTEEDIHKVKQLYNIVYKV